MVGDSTSSVQLLHSSLATNLHAANNSHLVVYTEYIIIFHDGTLRLYTK